MNNKTNFGDIKRNLADIILSGKEYVRCVHIETYEVCPLDDQCIEDERYRPEFCDGKTVCIYYEEIIERIEHAPSDSYHSDRT